MRPATALIALALLPACSTASPPTAALPPPAEPPSAGRPADPAASAPAVGPARRCILRETIVQTRAVGARAILFQGLGFAYRNDLPDRCPGLERGAQVALLFEQISSPSACEGDRVRAIIPGIRTPAESFPLCRLGPFTPVDPKRRR